MPVQREKDASPPSWLQRWAERRAAEASIWAPIFSLFKKNNEIGYFEVPAGARGQRRALRNHKAVVFPWKEAGPQAFRLSLRKSRPVLLKIASPSPGPVQVFPSKANIKSEGRQDLGFIDKYRSKAYYPIFWFFIRGEKGAGR